MTSAALVLVVGGLGQLGRCIGELCDRGTVPLIVAGRPEIDIEHASLIDRMRSSLSNCVSRLTMNEELQPC
jgi:dTDP-4-dehydrorhamnose reductase